MGLMPETSKVFDLLSQVFDCLPVAIRLLVYAAFGGVILLAVIRGLGR